MFVLSFWIVKFKLFLLILFFSWQEIWIRNIVPNPYIYDI